MRYERIRSHAMGVLGDFDLDLTQYGDARLLAIMGPNGCGKTTALGLMHGAVYRDVPTRGSIVDLARGRDAYVEVTVVNGKRWRIRQSADCISKKSETLILAEDGTPAIASTKVRDADAWVAQHFPSEEVVLASLFCAQQSQGFLGMTPSERKGLLLSALGISRLERLAESARERARATKAQVDTLAARLDDERRRGGDVAAIEAELATAREASGAADTAAAGAHQRLADAQAAAAAARAARDAYDVAVHGYRDQLRRRDELAAQLRDLEGRAVGLRAEAAAERAIAAELEALQGRLRQADLDVQVRADAAQRARAWVAEAQRLADAKDALEKRAADLQTRIEAVRARLTDAETRIQNNEAVIAERDTIEAAVADRTRILIEVERARKDAAAADAAALLADRESAEHRRANLAHIERAAVEATRVGRLREGLSKAEEIEAAARCLPGLARDVEAAERDQAKAEQELEELRGRHVAGAEERIVGLRGGLTEIANASARMNEDCAAEVAAETLGTDDAAIRAAAEIPGAITHAAACVARARERAERARRAHGEAAALAAQAERLEADRQALAGAEQASADEVAQAETAERARATAVQQAAANRGARDGYLERAAALAAQAEALAPTAAKATPLANAEARLAELRPAAEAARAELQAISAEASELATQIAGACRPDVEEARAEATAATAELDAAKRARDAIARDITGAEERLGRARTAAARLGELEPQIARARADLEGLGEPVAPGEPPDVAAACTMAGDAADVAKHADAAAREAHGAVAVAEQRLEQAQASTARVEELGAELGKAELDLADWTRLGADLGRDGLQAAEIDAAGPELTELVNDLLHACHGPRWTVTIETQRLSADGKKTLEGCEVRVLDTERGRDAPAETLSGGERVVVGEAVSLALAMLACRRAGVERPTIVRDESGAALDPENARVHVAMLRRAAEIVGADKVLVVSHTPEVWDLCDARVEIGGSA